jgi:uncharacterized membrane protein
LAAADLINEAATWGIRRRAASSIVAEILDQVLAAIAATAGDARVLAVIREQAERMAGQESRLPSRAGECHSGLGWPLRVLGDEPDARSEERK